GGPDSEVGWTMYLYHLKERADEMKKVYESPNFKITDAFPPEQSQEALIPFIESIATGRESRLILNVPNKGSIDGLPDDVMVEIPVKVNGKGVSNEKIGKLPPKVMIHVMMPRWQRMEWVLQAFVDGDKQSLILGLMEDQRTKTYEQAEEVVDDLLSQDWNSKLREHYR
ncbi:MAG: alpha-glucosidase/alpha-galactosidase, partial [Athalassotoga sp.]